MKKLLFIPALFLFLAVSLISVVNAQGNYSCQWVNLAQSCESPLPQTGNANCDPGHIPGGGCSGFTTSNECLSAGPFPCVAQQNCGATGQSCCSGGSCNSSNLTCQYNVCVNTPGGGGASPTCNGGAGIDTAIGCIPFDTQTSLISFILSWAIGIGGGVAFIMMLLAGFQIMTSAGNPDRLRAGQELLTSAIAGLILLVFSVFILRVIGIDILGITSLQQQ